MAGKHITSKGNLRSPDAAFRPQLTLANRITQNIKTILDEEECRIEDSIRSITELQDMAAENNFSSKEIVVLYLYKNKLIETQGILKFFTEELKTNE